MNQHANAPPTVLPKTLSHNTLMLGVFFGCVGMALLFMDAPQWRRNAAFILLEGFSWAIGAGCLWAGMRQLRRPRPTK